MGTKSVELAPVASDSDGEIKDPSVQTASNSLQSVSLSVLFNRFSTRGQRIAMTCGYICWVS